MRSHEETVSKAIRMSTQWKGGFELKVWIATSGHPQIEINGLGFCEQRYFDTSGSGTSNGFSLAQ